MQVKPDIIVEIIQSKAASTIESWITIDNVQKALTILGLVIGSLVAYVKFIRGRVYKPRLELIVTVTASLTNQARLVNISLDLKNIGSSMIRIRERGTAIVLKIAEVTAADLKNGAVAPVSYGEELTLSISADNFIIESGETSHHFRLVVVDPRFNVFSVRARAVMVPKGFSKGVEWNTKAALILKDEEVIARCEPHEPWLDC